VKRTNDNIAKTRSLSLPHGRSFASVMLLMIELVGLINRIDIVMVPWATTLTLVNAKVKGYKQQSLD
jgi:hypothetical protein